MLAINRLLENSNITKLCDSHCHIQFEYLKYTDISNSNSNSNSNVLPVSLCYKNMKFIHICSVMPGSDWLQVQKLIEVMNINTNSTSTSTTTDTDLTTTFNNTPDDIKGCHRNDHINSNSHRNSHINSVGSYGLHPWYISKYMNSVNHNSNHNHNNNSNSTDRANIDIDIGLNINEINRNSDLINEKLKYIYKHILVKLVLINI